MPGSLAPAFIEVQYHSEFSPHVMILPTKAANVNLSDPSTSTIDTWNAGTINWRTMTTALITLMQDQMSSTVNFDRGTLFTQEDADSTPVYIDSYSIDLPGTAAAPGWYKAAQHTIIARDTAGAIVKLVLLDAGTGNLWNPETDPTDAGYADLLAEWMSGDNGWSSRMDGQPSVFIRGFKTLNEKLRRAYRMG